MEIPIEPEEMRLCGRCLSMAVIWGDVKWEEAEAVQREMGKMILRCSSKMANEVVLGELGWWPLKARRDLLRLKFWGKIVSRMSSSRLVKHVYVESRKRMKQANGERCMAARNNHMQYGDMGQRIEREDTCTRRKGMACKDANKTQTTHIPHNQTQTRI